MNEGLRGISRDCNSAFPGRRAPSAGEPGEAALVSRGAGGVPGGAHTPHPRTLRSCDRPRGHHLGGEPLTQISPAKDGWHGRLAPKVGRPPPPRDVGRGDVHTRERPLLI